MHARRDAFVEGFKDGPWRGRIEEYGPRARWHESLRVPLVLIGFALLMFSCSAADSIRRRTAAFERCATATDLTDQCQMILSGKHAYESAQNAKGGQR